MFKQLLVEYLILFFRGKIFLMKKSIIILSLLVACLSAGSRAHAMDEQKEQPLIYQRTRSKRKKSKRKTSAPRNRVEVEFESTDFEHLNTQNGENNQNFLDPDMADQYVLGRCFIDNPYIIDEITYQCLDEITYQCLKDMDAEDALADYPAAEDDQIDQSLKSTTLAIDDFYCKQIDIHNKYIRERNHLVEKINRHCADLLIFTTKKEKNRNFLSSLGVIYTESNYKVLLLKNQQIRESTERLKLHWQFYLSEQRLKPKLQQQQQPPIYQRTRSQRKRCNTKKSSSQNFDEYLPQNNSSKTGKKRKRQEKPFPRKKRKLRSSKKKRHNDREKKYIPFDKTYSKLGREMDRIRKLILEESSE